MVSKERAGLMNLNKRESALAMAREPSHAGWLPAAQEPEKRFWYEPLLESALFLTC
jgi:hypothetical protein